ncbi:MAG: hypothetical protein JNN05_05185 [Candidatus Omnitrophica bacterium]|nr:hypothetical protein [Candidatus Omnitrophota bacterium]
MKGNVVLLSMWNNPDLPYYVSFCQEAKIPVSAIVCSGALKEHDLAILRQRLEPEYFDRDLLHGNIESIPFYFVQSHNNAAARTLFKSLKPDVLVNAGTPNILKGAVLNIPRLGVINSHPGLMPDYRGCTNVEWAIYNDDPVGSTCHFMTEAIDQGPVLAQKIMAVPRGWGYRKIRTEVVYHGIRVLTQGIKKAFLINKNYRQLTVSDTGTYYKVIDQARMQEVIKKTESGQYTSSVHSKGEYCEVL